MPKGLSKSIHLTYLCTSNETPRSILIVIAIATNPIVMNEWSYKIGSAHVTLPDVTHTPNATIFQIVRAMSASASNPHSTALIVIDAWFFVTRDNRNNETPLKIIRHKKPNPIKYQTCWENKTPPTKYQRNTKNALVRSIQAQSFLLLTSMGEPCACSIYMRLLQNQKCHW